MRREFHWAPLGARSLIWIPLGLVALLGGVSQLQGQVDEPPAGREPDRPATQDADRFDNRDDEPSARPRERGRESDRAIRRDEGQRAGSERTARSLRGERDQAGLEAPEGRRQPGLGMRLEEQGDEGLTIADLEPGSLAARAGLRANDRIISADGRQFTSSRRLMAYLSGQGGRRVPIIIERNGQQYTVHLRPLSQSEGAWLGVYLEDDDENQIGARVAHVYPTSPAARAGFRTGDVITRVEGQQVREASDVIALVEEMEPSSKAEFTVRRNDQEVELAATLGNRDAFVLSDREPQFDEGGRQQGYDDQNPFGRVPPYMMQLEHDRRMAEQHQRIEEALRELQEEVKQLREEISRGRR